MESTSVADIKGMISLTQTVILLASQLKLSEILLSCSGIFNVFATHRECIIFKLFCFSLHHEFFSSNHEKIRNNS